MILHNSNNVNGPARRIQITGCGWGEINISSLPCCLSTRSRARYQVRTCNFINFITQTRSLLDVVIQHIAPLVVCTGLHFGCSGSTRELPSQQRRLRRQGTGNREHLAQRTRARLTHGLGSSLPVLPELLGWAGTFLPFFMAVPCGDVQRASRLT